MKINQLKLEYYPHHINQSGRSELRKSLMFVLERDLNKIKKKRVLEIGCGDWDFAKKIVEKNQCQWYGLEPVNLGDKKITLVKGSVKEIPYHDNSFDVVLCSQTIEHWFEYGVSIQRALSEINRVLKPGGILMINAPIHQHGDPRFLMGELNKINALFRKETWEIVLFEQIFPKEKVQGWKRIASKGFFSTVGYPDFLIPNHKNAGSYLVNVHLKKRNPIENNHKNSIHSRNLTVITRFIKTYLLTRFFGDK